MGGIGIRGSLLSASIRSASASSSSAMLLSSWDETSSRADLASSRQCAARSLNCVASSPIGSRNNQLSVGLQTFAWVSPSKLLFETRAPKSGPTANKQPGRNAHLPSRSLLASGAPIHLILGTHILSKDNPLAKEAGVIQQPIHKIVEAATGVSLPTLTGPQLREALG